MNSTLENIMNSNQSVAEDNSKSVAFVAFAKERNLSGNWAGLKDPLYQRHHNDGSVEDVAGVRFETNVNGNKGFIFMALSKNAKKAGLANLMQAPATLQVRVANYNGYEQLMLCTGQSDRETSEINGTFSL